MEQPHAAVDYAFSLSGADRMACVALAIEERLGASALVALGLSQSKLSGRRFAQMTQSAGQVKPLRLSRGLNLEAAFCWSPQSRQLILRQAHRLGILRESAEASQKLLGRESRAPLILRLQEGSLRLRTDASELDPLIERELRASLLDPFDADFLEATWGQRATNIVCRVLEVALLDLHSVGPLLHWAARREQTEDSPGLAVVMGCHALHRMDEESGIFWLKRNDTSTRLAFEAVAHFQAESPQLAQKLLDESLSFAPKKHPSHHHFTPLLAFLLLTRRDEASHSRAQAWLKTRGASLQIKSAARGLRALGKSLNPSSTPQRRVAVHQLPESTSAWEFLFLALATYRRGAPEGSRASFSQVLIDKGQTWLESGYLWMGRQALVLAALLDEEQVKQAGLSLPGLKARSSDLASVVSPVAKWEAALHSLTQLGEELSESHSSSRLEWFVNPHTGSVNKPGLQELRRGQGWTTVSRLDFEEALKMIDALPPEDQRVLSLLSESHEPFPHAEVFRLLVDHPRVVDGARGGARLVVVRAPCELVSHEDADFITLRLSPPGIGPGLNLLYDGESTVSVVEMNEAMQRVVETLPADFKIPRSHAQEVAQALGRLAEAVPIRSPYLGGDIQKAADSSPCLRISPVFGAYLVEAGVRPFGEKGRFFSVGTGPGVLTLSDQGSRILLQRRFEEEEASLARLCAACPTLRTLPGDENQARSPGETLHSWSLNAAEMVTLLAEVRDSALPCQFEWPASGSQKLRASVSVQSLRGALRSKKGWYLVSGEVAIDQVTSISLAELVKLPTLARGRFVRLPNGDFLELEKKVRRVVAALSLSSQLKGDKSVLRIGHSRLPALAGLRGLAGFDFDEEVVAALEKWTSDEEAPAPVPPELKAELRPYQVEGFRWLKRITDLDLGVCLADDMGLGKTIQILAFLLTRPPGTRHLVVAPTSVCTNWLNEISRFAPSLQAIEYLGAKRKTLLDKPIKGVNKGGQIIIASYGLLLEDREQLASVNWDTVILDEAQFIKNPHSLRAQSAFSLKADKRILATGTPVENHLGDIWSLFHFLNPDLLGTWEEFETHFAKPIQREGDVTRAEILREMVRPYLLRRTKEEVLTELPPLTRVRHEITLSKDEGLRYALLRRQIHDKLRTVAGKRHTKLEVLAEITRLRRFCCHPQLVFPDAPLKSHKLEAMIDLVDELRQNGHRALIFSQYVDFLHQAMDRLDEQKIPYLSLDGSTPKAKRQKLIDEFQGGDIPLFLISLKAGGLGINLTGADYVIHLDPWWNPAAASQAVDRAYRMGQDKAVTVYEFVTRDTIEEDIFALHKTKKALSDSLLKGGREVATLNADELKRWLVQSSVPLSER